MIMNTDLVSCEQFVCAVKRTLEKKQEDSKNTTTCSSRVDGVNWLVFRYGWGPVRHHNT